MPLGVTLLKDIRVALDSTTSSSPIDFGNKFALAINNYLTPATYALGSLTYTSSVVGSAFELTMGMTNVQAAQKLTDGIMSYWVTDVVVGVPAIPTMGGVAVAAGTITVGAVKPSLLTKFTEILGDKTTGQYTYVKEFDSDIDRDSYYVLHPSELSSLTETMIVVSNDVEYKRLSNTWVVVIDTKPIKLSNAIKDSVALTITSHTETTAIPSTIGPFTGTIL